MYWFLIEDHLDAGVTDFEVDPLQKPTALAFTAHTFNGKKATIIVSIFLN